MMHLMSFSDMPTLQTKVWRIGSGPGVEVVVLSYSCAEGNLLVEGNPKVYKHLSFNPNLALRGQSKNAMISEVYVDRAGLVHFVFKNRENAPEFELMSYINQARFWLATKDESGRILNRYKVSFTPNTTEITSYYGSTDKKSMRLVLSDIFPGYMIVESLCCKI